MTNINRHHKSHQLAQQGAFVGILVYLLLTILKISGSFIFQSQALKADGLNNLSDIFSSLAVFIGLKIAKRPADHDHHFGHDKYEAISSFIVSIIMFLLALEVITRSINLISLNEYPGVDLKAVWVPLISVSILMVAYFYIRQLAQKSQSMGLKATHQDMRNDILITFSTIIGIIGSNFGLPWLDPIISILVGFIIFYSAFDILKDSTFTLSDGFDQEELDRYYECILKHPDVLAIRKIRARLSGKITYVDVIIEIDGNLTVYESHQITEEVEGIMKYQFNVRDVDVHVEPYVKNNP